MLRTLIRAAALAALLAAPVLAHEGADHEDIREGPAAPPAGAAMQSVDVQSGERRFRATVVQDPEHALVGEEVDLAVRAVELLDPPDPLLGPESPVIPEGVTVRLEAPEAKDLGPAHAEEPEGTSALHFRPERPGLHRLRFDLRLPGGGVLPVPVSVGVGGASPTLPVLPLVLAVLAAVGVLAARGRRPALIAGGLVLVLAGVLYVQATRETDPPPAAPAPSPAADTVPGLQIPPEMQQVVGLETERVRRETVSTPLEVPGTLAVPGGRSHSVHVVHAGRVVSMGVSAVGQPVRAGQVLAEVEEILEAADELGLEAQRQALQAQREGTEMQRADLVARRAELQARAGELGARRDELRSRVAERQALLERSRKLAAIEGISQQELEAARFAAEQARAQLAGVERELASVQGYLRTPEPPAAGALPSRPAAGTVVLTSPLDGVLSRVNAVVGQVAAPEDELFRVVDLSTLWVRARVPEADLARARGGRTAQVSTAAYPGPFPARLVTVGSEIDPASRTAEVVYAVDNRKGQLLDGMSATVTLTGASRALLTLPRAAVVDIDRQPHVFVRLAPDRFAPRPVRVEPAREGRLAVLEGLEAGEEVVSRGAAQMAAEVLRQGGH